MTTGAPGARRVVHVVGVTVAAVYLLVLSEWLFLVTRPSMFTVLGWPQRSAVLLAAALIAVIPPTAVAAGLVIVGGRLAAGRRRLAAAAGLLVPAAALSALGFLLIENFTRTVLGFNVGSFVSPVRYLYGVGWLLLAWWVHRRLVARLEATGSSRGAGSTKLGRLGGLSLLLASLVAAGVRYEPLQVPAGAGPRDDSALPDILLLSSDGVNAANMSAYGYRRATTPFLESRADEFLVSENHFTNSTMTTASVAALLSGKLPSDTGLLREGQVFQGVDVFQHLPGLLRQLGYYGVDISARVWGDAYDMNLRQGFHVSNGRSLRNESLPVLRWIARSYPSETYFLGLTTARLSERLLHALGLEDMEDPFDLVASKETPAVRDAERIRALEEALAQAPRPLFAQVHLYDTHRVPDPERAPGMPRRRFVVSRPVFSAGQEPTLEDYYDDTILAFDGLVERVMKILETRGDLDRTVLVINSDHGLRRAANVRLPLMIRFPGGEHRGRIVANTQRIDIAPTVLSYLGLQSPEWLRGRSLLAGEPDPLRRILVTGEGASPNDRWLSIVQCQRAWIFHVRSTWMEELSVPGHTAPCSREHLLGRSAARREMFDHLDLTGLLAVPFEMQLASLKQENNAEMRGQVMRLMGSGQAVTRPLGASLTVAHAYPDLWTYGTQPAAILVRNGGEAPRSLELMVASGEDREFPASFHVQDDQQTREHVFTGPGTLSVELPLVPPRSERLFLVWSDGTFTGRAGGRRLGVQLLLGGAWLSELLNTGDRAEWRQAATAILERRIPAVELDHGWLAANVYGDLWTRGSEPAGVVVRNDGDSPRVRRMAVRTGKGHEYPLRVYLHDGSEKREYRFDGPGSLVVDLPEVPPGTERLFLLRSERGWVGSGAHRELGVQLSPRPAS